MSDTIIRYGVLVDGSAAPHEFCAEHASAADTQAAAASISGATAKKSTYTKTRTGR